MSREKRERRRKAETLDRVLPVAPLRGEFLLCAAALRETERLLPTYRDERSDHEGIVFLLGHQLDELTIFTSCLAPNAETTRGSVHCSTAQMAEAIDAARAAGLSLLGQVHSHPKDWVEHSVGDDSMVFMPYENMLSIVAPWYGRTGLRPLASVGVHQYQDGRWVQGESDSVKTQLTVVPDSIDLR